MLLQVFSKWCVQTILQQIGENVIRKGISNFSGLQDYPFFPLYSNPQFLMYNEYDSIAFISYLGRLSNKEPFFEFGICLLKDLNENQHLVFLRQAFVPLEKQDDLCRVFYLECDRSGLIRNHPYNKPCFTLLSMKDYCTVTTFIDRLLNKGWEELIKENEKLKEKIEWLEKFSSL